MEIAKITELGDKRHIALLDTSSISFMQGLSVKVTPVPVYYRMKNRSVRQLSKSARHGMGEER